MSNPRTLFQVLLFNETVVQFLNNTADQSGGGIYVENFQSAALLPIQASGCFIQYYSNKFVPVAVPPTTWVCLHSGYYAKRERGRERERERWREGEREGEGERGRWREKGRWRGRERGH